MKKVLSFLTVVFLMLLPCFSVYAYPTSGSITVVMINKADKQPLENQTATVIKVADCSFTESDISFSLTADFSETEVDLMSTDAANDLYPIAKSKVVSGVSAVTDSEGTAVFAECDLGAYLVYSPDGIFNPFIVFIPMVSEDGASFNITAQPKIDIPEETTTEPHTDTDTDTDTVTTPSKTSSTDKLPQTGMLQFPIPVLGLCGALVFAKGFVVYVNGKKEEN